MISGRRYANINNTGQYRYTCVTRYEVCIVYTLLFDHFKAPLAIFSAHFYNVHTGGQVTACDSAAACLAVFPDLPALVVNSISEITFDTDPE